MREELRHESSAGVAFEGFGLSHKILATAVSVVVTMVLAFLPAII